MGYYIDLKSIDIDQYKTILKTTHLIPSWKVLEEDIDANLDTIKKQGINHLEALLMALKNKDKIQEFASISGLSEKYLAVLNRVVKGYRPKPNRIKDFQGISEDISNQLAALGIKNTLHLYDEVLTAEKRKEFSNKSGIHQEEVIKLTRLTDLSRIRWVNHTFANVLLEAGYYSAEQVANEDYQMLYRKIKDLNAERKIYKAHIGLNDMKMVIDFAQKLNFEIKYK